MSAVSDDGRWRWDGQRWIPNEVGVRSIGPVRYEATPDTRKLQIAVTAYLVASALYTSFLVPQTMEASMQNALRTTPGYDPSILGGMMTGITIFAIAGSVIWAGVLLLGTWSLWRWVYYLLMVLGALSAFSVLSNSLALAGMGTSAILPAWSLGLGIVYALLYFGLALWMFLLWRRYQSAWARRVIPI